MRELEVFVDRVEVLRVTPGDVLVFSFKRPLHSHEIETARLRIRAELDRVGIAAEFLLLDAGIGLSVLEKMTTSHADAVPRFDPD